MRAISFLAGILAIDAAALQAGELETIPEFEYAFLETYCLDCHDDFEMKGEISLEAPEIVWSDPEAVSLWQRVIKVVGKGEMPPEDEPQPSAAERESVVAWLDASLSKHDPIGGTALRRLNKREYRSSLNALFDIDYDLPESFPQDTESHGFDNQGDALAVSGPLLKAYAEVATDLAEKLFPPERKAVVPETVRLDGSEFTYSYSSGSVVDGVMRVVSSSESIAASGTWPSRHEAPTTGVYQVELQLSAFNPPAGETIICSVHAVDLVEAPAQNVNRIRQLAEFEVGSESVQTFSFEAVLEKGETIALRYANAFLKEDREQLSRYMKETLTREPLLAAAYLAADGKVGRGRVGWDRLKALMQSDPLPEPPTGEVLDQLIPVIVKDVRATTETFEYKHYEQGPALQAHGAVLHGPIELADSAADRYWKKRAERLLGPRAGRSDEQVIDDFLGEFLRAAFRRPVEPSVVEEYAGLARDEQTRTGRLEDGLHLVLRSALTSPYFLYRGFAEGRLDDYDLAARLAYFLTAAPPDSELTAAAESGRLRDSATLRAHAARLIDSERSNAFVRSFLDQWLDLALLEDLTPDATLFENPKVFNYKDNERMAYVEEPNRFFRELLDTNRPLEDFIDPDFTYTIDSVGRHVYGLPMPKGAEKDAIQRVSFERGGRFGGLLGMAGVMTATANGVDTQPVVRGVWALENILGNPPPPPPDAVPALTPDTSKAESPRELLAAHMAEPSCAGCHKKIDPIGFVLESFDPVGRWRTVYPDLSGRSKEQGGSALPVETDGVLPDGTELRDVRDLKAYLVQDIHPFAECLSEKLLTYATGRTMSYSDRKLIARMVEENEARDGGFKDLLLALVDCESFRVK